VWANAYDRLKPYGEAMTMLEREPVVQDNRLRGTSAWANTFLGRDHYAHGTEGEEA
jgi:methylenetetrahydrofolate reductase (NADPH)